MSIKRKFGMALATTALGAMLIGGGTFALFTDTASNNGNTFTAGDVDIHTVGPTNSHNTYSSNGWDFGNLAPGDSGSKEFTITNKGSLDVWVKMSGYTHDDGYIFTEAHGLQIDTSNEVVFIAAGGTAKINVNWRLPIAFEKQGATGTATVNFVAVQARNNSHLDADNKPVAPIYWNNSQLP